MKTKKGRRVTRTAQMRLNNLLLQTSTDITDLAWIVDIMKKGEYNV